jgi:hypothetical protein
MHDSDGTPSHRVRSVSPTGGLPGGWGHRLKTKGWATPDMLGQPFTTVTLWLSLPISRRPEWLAGLEMPADTR